MPDGVIGEIEGSERVRFGNSDGSAIVQVGRHILAVNVLKAYPGWAQFRPLVERVLGIYREIAQPNGFARIGLRYLNMFTDLPHPTNLEEFFNFYPFVGPKLPQMHSLFLTGVNFDHVDGRDQLRLQISSAITGQPPAPAIQLDLDYYLAQPGGVGFEDFPGWFVDAHTRVAETFEGAITDRLRERLEPIVP
jgi:uncharacterized protein (TIGR04255 family)